jgi:hypothetical protein
MKDKLARTKSQGDLAPPSIETIIAQRHLQEQFCAELVRCAQTDSVGKVRPGETAEGASFISCLRDVALKDVYATPQ